MKASKVLLPTIALLISISLMGRDITHSTYLKRASVSVGSKLVLFDDLPSNANNVLLRSAAVHLSYDRNGQTDVCTSALWEYEVQVKVYPEDNPSEFTTHDLLISYGADGEYIYDSKAVLKELTGEAYVMEVTALDARYSLNDGASYTSLTGNPSSSNANLPADISLNFELYTEHYSYLHPDSTGFVYYDATSQEVRWRPTLRAEEYDVEWVFIDSEDENYDNLLAGQPEDPFDYKEPSRVRTTATRFYLPLIYPSGKVFFRARPVGRFINGTNGDYGHIKLGKWGYEKSPSNTSVAGQAISTGFEASRIWQYQVNYAENGKNKRLVSYYDGTLRQRQMATNINSKDITLVSESKYDQEGRAALSILPAPVSGFDMAYKTNFNVVNSGLDSYEKEDFEKASPDPMYAPASGSYGAEQYHSANNQFTSDPFRDILPLSDGYPFVQTQYVNDNTGRVRSSSGLGPDHKVSSGHDTKMFYGTPTSTELYRLFGTNVGQASYYKKNTVLDPNRQASVNYMDQQGRTIATALVGDPPSNLVSIAPAGQSITVNLTENNVYDTASGEIRIIHRFVNLKNTNYTFNYQFDAAHYPITVNDPSQSGTTTFCMDCDYELEITVTDPNGSWVTLQQGTSTVNQNKIVASYSGSGGSCTVGGSTSQAGRRL